MTAHRKKGEQRRGARVYCGAAGSITRDHPFPEVIFLGLDDNMITVPSYAAYQQTKDGGDGDLRNVIILDIGGRRHPGALAMAERMLKERNVRLRNWLRKRRESMRSVDLVTDTGVIVDQTATFEFDTARIVAAREMVVRGLYFRDYAGSGCEG